MIDINNIRNYKNCQKKLYTIHVCMPELNTIVVNKLEQPETLKFLKGKSFIQPHEYNSNPALKAAISQLPANTYYITTQEQPFVLAGTLGEMWTIKPAKLASTYTFADKTPINSQTLQKKVKSNMLDWTPITTIPNNTVTMACFVPLNQKFQVNTAWGTILNGNIGRGHGLGDFIVCAKLPNGQPNLQDRWIVNGNIFATTYNNRGWSSYLDPKAVLYNFDVNELPKLVINKESKERLSGKELVKYAVNLVEFYKNKNSSRKLSIHTNLTQPERYGSVVGKKAVQLLNSMQTPITCIYDRDSFTSINFDKNGFGFECSECPNPGAPRGVEITEDDFRHFDKSDINIFLK